MKIIFQMNLMNKMKMIFTQMKLKNNFNKYGLIKILNYFLIVYIATCHPKN